jgi:hypothetical protein
MRRCDGVWQEEAYGRRTEVSAIKTGRGGQSAGAAPGGALAAGSGNQTQSEDSRVAGLGHVHYVDLCGTLSSKLANYKDWWANELHPTEKGFEGVTKKFVAVLPMLP